METTAGCWTCGSASLGLLSFFGTLLLLGLVGKTPEREKISKSTCSRRRWSTSEAKYLRPSPPTASAADAPPASSTAPWWKEGSCASAECFPPANVQKWAGGKARSQFASSHRTEGPSTGRKSPCIFSVSGFPLRWGAGTLRSLTEWSWERCCSGRCPSAHPRQKSVLSGLGPGGEQSPCQPSLHSPALAESGVRLFSSRRSSFGLTQWPLG